MLKTQSATYTPMPREHVLHPEIFQDTRRDFLTHFMIYLFNMSFPTKSQTKVASNFFWKLKEDSPVHNSGTLSHPKATQFGISRVKNPSKPLSQHLLLGALRFPHEINSFSTLNQTNNPLFDCSTHRFKVLSAGLLSSGPPLNLIG